ncbi:MAG: lipase family protein, partial [Desulfotomaculaceae bacterium]|nr:lipase family protein [Desulfotomaculaceae bacterium]
MGTNNEIDKTLAVFLANICIQTYNQYANEGNFDMPDGYSLVDGFKATAINRAEWFGFIIKSGDNIVVGFRGTQSETDWLANANAAQTGYAFAPSRGKIHRGFMDIYVSCREKILYTLRKLPANSNVYITGHSLGGALA